MPAPIASGYCLMYRHARTHSSGLVEHNNNKTVAMRSYIDYTKHTFGPHQVFQCIYGTPTHYAMLIQRSKRFSVLPNISTHANMEAAEYFPHVNCIRCGQLKKTMVE